MEKKLTQAEIDERVAILKRFRGLLEEQRNKFREYLLVLEKQESKIADDDGEAVSSHADLEANILKNIAGLQKVIVPMQSMYKAVAADVSAEDKAEVLKVQNDLAQIQQQVLAQNEKNQHLLREHISQIREQLDTLMTNNPYRGKRSVYAEKVHTGNLVAIEV